MTTNSAKLKRELLDDDGENLAVRWFLAAYSGGVQNTKRMREHMDACGFPFWPEWAAANDQTLTKGGAQSWLRHLFALEGRTAAQGEHKAWINAKTRMPNKGELIVKRFANGAVWAGKYAGTTKDSSFDYWMLLEGE